MILELPFAPDRFKPWTQGAPQDPAPWCYFSKSTEKLRDELASWLASAKTGTRGPVLVTGLRGVGKTSFVGQALNQAANKVATESKAGQGPRVMLLPVWLDVPKVLNPTQLLRRLVRRLYRELVRLGIGQFRPDVVAQARAAYIRTLAERADSSEKKLAVGLALDPEAYRLGAKAELELARKIELTYARSEAEEVEEDIAGLLEMFDETSTFRPWAERAATTIDTMVTQLNTFLGGASDGEKALRTLEIRVVFVLDELDKLAAKEFEKIFRSLKSLLTACSASFVLVGGVEQEVAWLRAQNHANDILTTLISWRVYVPTLQNKQEVMDLTRKLAGHPCQEAHAGVLLERSGGVPKSVARLLRNEFTKTGTSIDPERPADYLVANRGRETQGFVTVQQAVAKNQGYVRDAMRMLAGMLATSNPLGLDALVQYTKNVQALHLPEGAYPVLGAQPAPAETLDARPTGG